MVPTICTKSNFTHAFWLPTWWWQPSWILPSWIQSCCTKLWLNLIHSDSNSFILTQLDDGSHLEFCHLGFSHLHKKNFTHAFSLKLMMAAILNSAILDSAILHKKVHLFILTQLDDGSHLAICHLGFSHLHKKNFTHAFSLNLMMATILNSAILDSAILHKTLTQSSSIWLKLIHSHSTWWYQTSWTLPCWIQTLPSWIQTPCYLLSDLLKNTLPPLWPWLKLIQSD